MRAHSPDRSLLTLFTGAPHSAGATTGDTVSILVRHDKFGCQGFVIIDARDTTIGTFAPAENLYDRRRQAGELLGNTIWAWRQGLRMAGLDLEITAYGEADRRLDHVEEYLRAETPDPKDSRIDDWILSLRNINLKLVRIPP